MLERKNCVVQKSNHSSNFKRALVSLLMLNMVALNLNGVFKIKFNRIFQEVLQVINLNAKFVKTLVIVLQIASSHVIS